MFADSKTDRSNWDRSADQPSGSGHNWRGISFDAIVVTAGGAASGYFIEALRNLNVTVNTRGRHKFPEFINSLLNKKNIGKKQLIPQPLTIKNGIIYLMGDLLGSIISLSRRHYAFQQAGFLAGDSKWLQELKYVNENPNQIISMKNMYSSEEDPQNTRVLYNRLFWNLPKEEAANDLKLLNSFDDSKIIDRTLVRVRELLAYTGRNEIDPIGVYKHFKEWRHFHEHTQGNARKINEKDDYEAKESTLDDDDEEISEQTKRIPVLFIMFDDLISTDQIKRNDAEKALQEFLQLNEIKFYFEDLSRDRKREVGILSSISISLLY